MRKEKLPVSGGQQGAATVAATSSQVAAVVERSDKDRMSHSSLSVIADEMNDSAAVQVRPWACRAIGVREREQPILDLGLARILAQAHCASRTLLEGADLACVCSRTMVSVSA